MALSGSVWRSLMTRRPMSWARRLTSRLASPSGASRAATSNRRCSVSSAVTSRSSSSGIGRLTRTGPTIGAKSAITLRFSGCWSGMSSSAESTSETVFSARKACCLRRSSSSVSAEESAAKPERPEVARIFFSHVTDSVPSAWRFSRL